MYEIKKKIGKVLTSKFVGTGLSSYEKRIYRATVSQRLRNSALDHRFLNDRLRTSGGPQGCTKMTAIYF